MIYETFDNPIALEEEFYSKEFYFSYSGLSRLLYSPKLFYSHYVLQQREERTDSHLIEGKLLHCLLLDPESVDEQFVISPKTLPSDNVKTVVDRVYKYAVSANALDQDFKSFSSEILEILKEINLHQSLKTDEQRIEKVATEQSVAYFDFLKTRNGKDIIDTDTYMKCLDTVQLLRQEKEVTSLLGTFTNNHVKVYNEMPLQVRLAGFPFGIKGIVDNIVIDEIGKTITINDLKTTSKTIAEFPESVEYYNYWLQAAIYKKLVIDYFDLDSSWEINFNFIVIDKYEQIYIFAVSKETMAKWYDTRLMDTLAKAKYHYDSRNYSLPYDMAVNKVVL
jgi:hypothetical protein